MNFTYENQGTHTYLVYAVSPEDAVDSMSLGMLTNNRIPGLAQTYFTQMDATKFIKYDVSAKIPVKQFFAGQVNKKRLIGVFNGIVNAMLFAEEYMIDVNSILLDLDYIFADVSTCETVLVCLPVVSDDLSHRDLGAFFKNIMFTTQFDQTESCDHVAKIINYLNSAPVFSLEDFKGLLDVISSAPQAPVAPVMPAVQPAPQPAPRKARKATQLDAAPAPAPQQPAQTPVPAASPVQPAMTVPAPVAPMPKPAQAPQAPQSVPAAPAQPAPGGKKMSMFDLLMHYSKENADLYKAQKAAAKAGQSAPATPSVPAPAAPAKAPGGFAIPGQPAPTPAAPAKAPGGFAIPGQPAPTPAAPAKAPGGFAIPGKAAPAAAPAPMPAQQPVQAPPAFVPAPATPVPQGMPHGQPTVFAPPSMPQGQSMNFGETTVLGVGGDSDGTTVLSGGTPAQVIPHLIRVNTQEKININKPVFRIGREASFVDYVVANNTSISRSHANIISRGGEYFVMDTNSANHTYVDGAMIQSNAEVRIMHGTKIKLANEDFEFKLY